MPHLDLSKQTRALERIQNVHFLSKLKLYFCCIAIPSCLFFFLTFLQYPNLSFSLFSLFFPLSSIPYHQSFPPFLAGERVLASGSVQLPRFTLLESGSLLISPSHLSDAGTYTCMASNSRGIDEASADLVVWGKHNRNWILPCLQRLQTPVSSFSTLSSTGGKYCQL